MRIVVQRMEFMSFLSVVCGHKRFWPFELRTSVIPSQRHYLNIRNLPTLPFRLRIGQKNNTFSLDILDKSVNLKLFS